MLERKHLALVALVIHAGEVEDAVDHRLRHIGGVLGADHHVAELARSRAHRPILIDREREHVGGRVAPAVLAVERRYAARVDQLDRDVAAQPRAGQRQLGRTSQARRRTR